MESAITSKGQATIPKAIREHLGLKPGDRIKFFVHPDGSVVLLPKLPVSVLRGIVAGRRRTVTIDEMERGCRRRCPRRRAARKASMIGLDTNILVRYFAQDDPVQSHKATEIIEGRLTEEDPGFISVVAIVEIAWVLDRAYGLSDNDVAAAIERILQADALLVENEQEVFAAMVALRDGNGSFADALIGALGARAGCARTLTFDRKALRLPGFALA